MNKNLGLLIAQGFDLKMFWSCTVTEYEISLIGWNTSEVKAYVLSKGFEVYDYCYADNPKVTELTNNKIRIVLMPMPNH
jgi:hypothetical protein